jgi:hypothetical protein
VPFLRVGGREQSACSLTAITPRRKPKPLQTAYKKGMRLPVRRARLVPVFLGIVVLAATVVHAAISSHSAVSPTMHAFVHEDASIGLTFDDGTMIGSQGKTPPTIPPGTYTIRVTDDAYTHNFHLFGPGVEMATPVDELASPTWTVTFQPGGTYKFQCDVHADYMYGVFLTSGASSSSGGSSSGGSSSGGSSSGGSSSGGSSSAGSKSSATTSKAGGSQTTLLGTLAGTVGSAGKLTLALNGKAVSKLKAGRYKVTVVDKTPARSFVIKQNGHSAITVSGVAFVGTHSVTVNLTAGQWTFSTSAGAKSTSSFIVVA